MDFQDIATVIAFSLVPIAALAAVIWLIDRRDRQAQKPKVTLPDIMEKTKRWNVSFDDNISSIYKKAYPKPASMHEDRPTTIEDVRAFIGNPAEKPKKNPPKPKKITYTQRLARARKAAGLCTKCPGGMASPPNLTNRAIPGQTQCEPCAELNRQRATAANARRRKKGNEQE